MVIKYQNEAFDLYLNTKFDCDVSADEDEDFECFQGFVKEIEVNYDLRDLMVRLLSTKELEIDKSTFDVIILDHITYLFLSQHGFAKARQFEIMMEHV